MASPQKKNNVFAGSEIPWGQKWKKKHSRSSLKGFARFPAIFVLSPASGTELQMPTKKNDHQR